MLGTSVNVLLEYMQIQREFGQHRSSLVHRNSNSHKKQGERWENSGKILVPSFQSLWIPLSSTWKKCWIGHRQGCGWKNHAADLSLLGTFWGTGKNIRDDFLLKGLGFNVSFGAGTSQCCDPKSSGLRSFFEQPPLYRTCLGYQANHISKKCCREIFFAHETWHVDEVPCQISEATTQQNPILDDKALPSGKLT